MKKNSLRIKGLFGVGHGAFRTPLGRAASLGHNRVQTDALEDAQESSHACSPPFRAFVPADLSVWNFPP